ncbi:hypothetical protein CLV51_102409 [Chitinophaga niastensis]|uniref:Uncharacterized protein n=1 Tax=Chitinophaga niastensis TaxID=536980 RepID=A0A2P8HMV2_CHINA|nr:hypothetical protein CLV51_102409 [Chitinophaga niastensis]
MLRFATGTDGGKPLPALTSGLYYIFRVKKNYFDENKVAD